MADSPSSNSKGTPVGHPPRDVFLIGLHHLGYLVADIPSAAAHFSQVLGYHIESEIVEDPAQTARVQFLRQPGTKVWLELISPSGQGGKLANALAKGGGYHHLCYEVNDLDLACATYRERDCLMVGPPTPAVAFGGRRIAWFMDRRKFLFELVETGTSPLCLGVLLNQTR